MTLESILFENSAHMRNKIFCLCLQVKYLQKHVFEKGKHKIKLRDKKYFKIDCIYCYLYDYICNSKIQIYM